MNDDPISMIKNLKIEIKPVKEEIIEPNKNDFGKIKKLEMLRQNILEQEKKDKVKKEAKEDKEMKSKVDFYSQKLYRFLLSSFLMNLVLEPFYLYCLTYDYIISYFDSGESILHDYSNTWFHIFFFGFKIIGLIVGGRYLLKPAMENENVAQKTFSLLLIFAVLSTFISTKVLPGKNFFLFCFFYCGLPGFFTGSLFYIMNIARLGKKENMNFKLIFSYSCFATIGNYFLMALTTTLVVNFHDKRPALINTSYGKRSILQPIYFHITGIENRLLFVPLYIAIFGFSALFTLYGLDWRAKEVPTMGIDWQQFDQFRNKHNKPKSKNIRLSDIIDYFEDSDKEDDDYTLVMDDLTMKSRLSQKSSKKGSRRISKTRLINSGRTSRPGEKSKKIDPQTIIVSVKEEKFSYKKILFTDSFLFLILCLACVFTIPFYFAIKTRALNLRNLFIDSKTIPLMLSESIISGVISLLNVLIFYYIKSHKYSLVIHIFYSLLFVLFFDMLLDFTFGVVFISFLTNFLLTNAQIMMTVMMTITIMVEEIPNFLPAIYASQLLAQIALYFGVLYHEEEVKLVRTFFIGCLILAFIFVYGVKTRKLRKMVIKYNSGKNKKKEK